MENDKMSDLKISKECNDVFDNIIETRRSIRFFKDEMPPKEFIEDIIKAGLFAPYAAQAVGGEE